MESFGEMQWKSEGLMYDFLEGDKTTARTDGLCTHVLIRIEEAWYNHNARI